MSHKHSSHTVSAHHLNHASNHQLAHYEKIENVQVIDFEGTPKSKVSTIQTCQRNDWACQIKSLFFRFLQPKTL